MESFLTKRYLIYRFFSSMFFIGAVWLYFYRLFINDQQVGILDGISFAIGLIAEVPSGALADKFGRDKIAKLGQLLMGLGFLTQGLSNSFAQILIGNSIVMIGAAFTSGADEALFFQRLSYSKDSLKWRKLVTRGGQMALMGSVTALVLGGFLHQINPRVPWIFSSIAFTASALIIWTIKDTREKRQKNTFILETKQYLQDIGKGFKEFLHPQLFLYFPIIIILQGLFYTAGWGVLRLFLLDRFHFSPIQGSISIASIALITVGLLHLTHNHAEKLGEKKILTFISLTAIFSLLFSVFDIGLWGYIVLFILYAGEHVLYPYMSEIINTRVKEENRATVLSVASFIRALPYIVLAPIIGYLNSQRHLEYYLIFWAILIFFTIIFYILKKSTSKISVNN